MSRINYPREFAEQRKLLAGIVEQNQVDTSIIAMLLDNQKIDLKADEAQSDLALAHEQTRTKLSDASEGFRMARDLAFGPVQGQIRSCAQFLKSGFSPNYKRLLEWGIPVTVSGKINYPSTFDGLSGIFLELQTKHDSYPLGESPLQVFLDKNKIDLAASGLAVTEAIKADVQFSKDGKSAERSTEQRDNVWGPVDAHIHRIGDYLKKLYENDPRALGEWGFVVDDTAPLAKERIGVVKIGQTTTTNGIVLYSTFTNVGTVDLYLQKGKNSKAAPVKVAPGESVAMVKGYSTIIVTNPSQTVEGKFKVTISR